MMSLSGIISTLIGRGRKSAAAMPPPVHMPGPNCEACCDALDAAADLPGICRSSLNLREWLRGEYVDSFGGFVCSQ